jgi:ActR/RegA family two-component response regulator
VRRTLIQHPPARPDPIFQAVTEKILIVEDDDDMRDALTDVAADLVGKEVVAASGLAEVISRRIAALGCELAILDINLGRNQPSGLDVFDWLLEERFPGRIVFLTGHARSHPLVARALGLGAALLVKKPVDVSTLLGLMEQPAP